MPETRTIKIDLDVHKLIEGERGGFSETPNDVLRRLLGIDPPPGPGSGGRPWSSHGVTLPHGTRLRMIHRGREYTGVVDDGRWLVEGERFDSPTGATGVATKRDGSPAHVDGWNYWRAMRPGERGWVVLDRLRKGR